MVCYCPCCGKDFPIECIDYIIAGGEINVKCTECKTEYIITFNYKEVEE